ncbi:hypothetical protein ACV22V_32755, partial [Burkholderia sp. AW33-5]
AVTERERQPALEDQAALRASANIAYQDLVRELTQVGALTAKEVFDALKSPTVQPKAIAPYWLSSASQAYLHA